MQVYKMGYVPWEDSQLLYHAMAYAGREGLILVAPVTPMSASAIIRTRQEIDLDYCREHDIFVFRREVGGGATYLDGDQLFFQVILSNDHPLARRDKISFFQALLEPVAAAYAELGVPTRYKPVNDILDHGRAQNLRHRRRPHRRLRRHRRQSHLRFRLRHHGPCSVRPDEKYRTRSSRR